MNLPRVAQRSPGRPRTGVAPGRIRDDLCLGRVRSWAARASTLAIHSYGRTARGRAHTQSPTFERP
jgi:hypothetical protein